MYVFVYGSLRRGGFLHSQHFTEKNFVKSAKTIPGYTIYDITGGAFPAMLTTPENTNQVFGEVYEVDDVGLAILDRVEGHPDLYLRSEIELEDGTRVQSYLFDQHRGYCEEVVESGDWLSYLIENGHLHPDISKFFR